MFSTCQTSFTSCSNIFRRSTRQRGHSEGAIH
jgi:hypothetical protein